jgi:hypothetical protein
MNDGDDQFDRVVLAVVFSIRGKDRSRRPFQIKDEERHRRTVDVGPDDVIPILGRNVSLDVVERSGDDQ